MLRHIRNTFSVESIHIGALVRSLTGTGMGGRGLVSVNTDDSFS